MNPAGKFVLAKLANVVPPSPPVALRMVYCFVR